MIKCYITIKTDWNLSDIFHQLSYSMSRKFYLNSVHCQMTQQGRVEPFGAIYFNNERSVLKINGNLITLFDVNLDEINQIIDLMSWEISEVKFDVSMNDLYRAYVPNDIDVENMKRQFLSKINAKYKSIFVES